jgi:uncharacterized protein YjbI with pentapeptide repeats
MNVEKFKFENKDFSEVVEFLKSHQLFLQEKEEGRRASFMHIDFSGFDFSRFDISKAVFKNCNLAKATIRQPILNEVEFDGCELSESLFYCKEVCKSSFSNCKANSILLSNISFESCDFVSFFSNGGVFTKNSFFGCNLQNSIIQNGDFNSSQFQECHLMEVNFSVCDFAYSNVVKSALSQVEFWGADMHSCNFVYCEIFETKFKSIKINSEGGIIKTSLKNSKFQDCKLQKCFFEEKKEDLAKLIIKIKNKRQEVFKNHLIVFLLSKSLIVVISATFFALNFYLGFEIERILLPIFAILLSSFILVKEMSFKRINFQSALIKSKIFTILPSILAGLTFFVIWLQSLKYEDFTFSLSIFLLFLLGMLNSLSYIFSTISYNKNK